MATRRFSPPRKFNRDNLEKVPEKPPLVYKIKNQNGENIYTGSAKSGRGRERLLEHLPEGPDPVKGGVQFQIKPMPSITEENSS